AQYLERMHVPKEAIDRVCTADNIDMGRLTRYAEDFYSACSSVGLCIRVPLVATYTLESLADLYAATTGIETDPAHLMKAGETAWNIIKMANAREGFSRKDDRVPDAFFEPVTVGGKTLTLRDYFGKPMDRAAVERVEDNYYDERGWNVKDSLPTREKLTELGLGDMVPDMERAAKR
ncbi:MAG: aldehyde ferredoxin oxidoreductase C-terminal domain-containing protein, partial [Dehalococcoidia bacterium]|nr:aldehyde ferredoxin oxidoreductase C-terminal domain-containing protein [Dehalococcoidia bacterium]